MGYGIQVSSQVKDFDFSDNLSTASHGGLVDSCNMIRTPESFRYTSPNDLTFNSSNNPPFQQGNVDGTANVKFTFNLIRNRGFEKPFAPKGSYQYNPPGGSWSFAGNSGLTGNGSTFTSNNPDAVEGTQAAFLQFGNGSVISQAISGLLPGASYRVAFIAAQRGNFNDPPGQDFDVMIDNSRLGTFRPDGTSYSDFSVSFTATASTQTLKFVGRNSAGGDHSVLIDNVRLNLNPVTVGNNGFETPNVGSGDFNSFQYNPLGGIWSFLGNSGISGNGSGFTSNNPNAVEGIQAAFLQFGNGSVILQTIGGLRSGVRYRVAFIAAQRGNFNDPPGQDFEVMIDNSLLGRFRPDGTGYSDYSVTFVAGASSHVLKFVGRNSAGGDHTVLIDRVAVLPIGN